MSVRARDTAGHLSAWTGATCTATPLDDRSMWRSNGWMAGRGSGYYKGTFLKAWEFNAALGRGNLQAKRISIVATTCKSCGAVKVYWNGKVVATVNLYSATTVKRKVIPITTFSTVRTGTLLVRSWSDDKWVTIDGLVASRT